MKSSVKNLVPKKIRKNILDMAFNGSTVHIGCALCLVEIFCVIYRNHLRYDFGNPNDPNRDYLILSKGHGVMAQYACMKELGLLKESDLLNYFSDGTKLKGLSDSRVEGLEVTSGSLGHGLSVGVGIAFGNQIKNTDQKTWAAIIVTTLAVIYIFNDSFERGDVLGNVLGLICAMGLAVGAVIIRSAKKINLVPSAMMGKLMVTLIALLFADNLVLKGNDTIIIPLMCIMCVAIPFVLITLAPRYISAAEVNLFFLLATILGPIWVWLVIKEQPSTETIIGGIVIIATIATHSILSLKKT